MDGVALGEGVCLLDCESYKHRLIATLHWLGTPHLKARLLLLHALNEEKLNNLGNLYAPQKCLWAHTFSSIFATKWHFVKEKGSKSEGSLPVPLSDSSGQDLEQASQDLGLLFHEIKAHTDCKVAGKFYLKQSNRKDWNQRTAGHMTKNTPGLVSVTSFYEVQEECLSY